MVCWIVASHAGAEYALRLQERMSFWEEDYLSQRCQQTHRQLLKAIESLARVGSPLTPMQVNI
jgi:hypothetical protein